MNSRIRHALIMAAGRGRRMLPLTSEIPKPMAAYQDSTLIAHGISRIRSQVPNVHVTVGHLASVLAPHLVEHGVSSIFNTNDRSNAWWIHHTLMARLDEPIFVLTCDNVTEVDFGALEADYMRLGMPPCMIVPVAPVEGLEGDYIFREKNVVTRLSRTEKSDIYCSGIQILNPHRVVRSTRPDGDFYAIWRQLIARRMLLVSDVLPTSWFTVDTVGDLDRLQAAKEIKPL